MCSSAEPNWWVQESFVGSRVGGCTCLHFHGFALLGSWQMRCELGKATGSSLVEAVSVVLVML